MFRLLIVILCCTLSSFAWGFDISRVAEPPEAKTVYVGDVVQNGIPMQMKQFSSSLTTGEVLSYYRINWADNTKVKENVPAFIEKEAGDWSIISKLEGNYSVVVQVKTQQSGGSEGVISVSNLTRPPGISELSKKFPKLGGTQLISSTESRDGGKHATTLILVNEFSVDSNDAFYRSRMTAEGWRLVRGGVRDGTATMLFNKQGQQCEMAVSEGERGDSVIIANIVAAP